MSFKEELNIEIDTDLNKEGFIQLRQQLKKTEAQVTKSMGKLRAAQQFNRIRGSVNRLQEAMDEVDMTLGEGGQFFQEGRQGALGKGEATRELARGLRVLDGAPNIDEAIGPAESPMGMMDSLEQFDPSSFRMGDVSGAATGTIDSLPRMGIDVPGLEDLPSPNFDMSANETTRFDAALNRVNQTLSKTRASLNSTKRSVVNYAISNSFVSRMSDKLSGRLTQLNLVLQKTGVTARLASVSVTGLAGSLAKAAPSARKLQMRLLGLQFTLLTVAFIFGALMMGGLGAVGVFEVLGNTLKFLFLPTALNVLDGTLRIQEAIMGLDESTRRAIGDFVFWVAVILGVLSVFAVFGKLLVSVGSFITSVTGALGSLIGFFSKADTAGKGLIGTLKKIGSTDTIIGGLKTIGGAIKSKLISAFKLLGRFLKFVFRLLKGGFKVLKSLGRIALKVGSKLKGFARIIGRMIASAITKILVFLGPLLSFFAGIAAGFLSVVLVAKKFGKKVALVFGAILIAIGAVVAAIVSIPAVVAAAIGLIIGAILGLIYTFRDEIVNVVQGVVNAIVGFFKWLWNKLVGNSIIPDMVSEIVDFIMSIPGKIVNLGSNIVDTIVKGIKNAGSAIWDAFKSILPDFLVDAIEGAGKAVKGIVDAGGNVVNAAGDLVQGGANAVAGLFGGGNNGGGTTKNVKNEDVTFNAEVEGAPSNKTRQEQGEDLGRTGAEAYSNYQGNNKNGLG